MGMYYVVHVLYFIGLHHSLNKNYFKNLFSELFNFKELFYMTIFAYCLMHKLDLYKLVEYFMGAS